MIINFYKNLEHGSTMLYDYEENMYFNKKWKLSPKQFKYKNLSSRIGIATSRLASSWLSIFIKTWNMDQQHCTTMKKTCTSTKNENENANDQSKSNPSIIKLRTYKIHIPITKLECREKLTDFIDWMLMVCNMNMHETPRPQLMVCNMNMHETPSPYTDPRPLSNPTPVSIQRSTCLCINSGWLSPKHITQEAG
jgi:hypothetical protein